MLLAVNGDSKLKYYVPTFFPMMNTTIFTCYYGLLQLLVPREVILSLNFIFK